MTYSADGSATEARWPEVEFIVGNPPFLGDKLMIVGLGEGYVAGLRRAFSERVRGGADLVMYWFEKARDGLGANPRVRIGLVATNSIRSGANRDVLERIQKIGSIFEAWSDEPWIVDGAAVRVSIVCFARSAEAQRLDGIIVSTINSDLTSEAIDLTKVNRLRENQNIGFIGTQKTGKFEISGEIARQWLKLPVNPNKRPNSDVLKPWLNGSDVAGRPSGRWIIDFGVNREMRDAQLYEAPFEYLREGVFEARQGKRETRASAKGWIMQRPRPHMREAVSPLNRFIVTPRVAKHRIFVWVHHFVVPDTRLVVIARDDETSFGTLHSRFHESWSLRTCSWHGVGNDPTYNAMSCFETFPFPEGLTLNIPAEDYANDPRAKAIAMAARRLGDLRNSWLNPADLVRVESEVVPGYPDRILPKDAQAAMTLRERTLTNLYNQSPQWLEDAHRDLDVAVAAAYGWPADISEEKALAKLLDLNLSRAAAGKIESVAADDETDD